MKNLILSVIPANAGIFSKNCAKEKYRNKQVDLIKVSTNGF